MTFCATNDVNVSSARFLHGHAGHQGACHGHWTATNWAAAAFFLFPILAVAEGAALYGAMLVIVQLGRQGTIYL